MKENRKIKKNDTNSENTDLFEVLYDVFDSDRLTRIVVSNPKKKSTEVRKLILRPVMLHERLMYQCEYHFLKKVTHQNLEKEECAGFVMSLIRSGYRQADIFMTDEDITILASKPEKPRIIRKKAKHEKPGLSHNRIKMRPIPEGKPCDFLHLLGVMDERGNVFSTHYGKYRQINRYLEIVGDVVRFLPKGRPARIIDFGCGKAYLTFALYYYLHDILGMDIHVTGLDLKQDVIAFCSDTAAKLGYEGLDFEAGDISTYEGSGADMVVSLHACDTATDFALINACGWDTKVILSVPCCQHELFPQIRNDLMDHMLSFGIIRDKFTEILTDALRADKLEAAGYDVSMIEFTSLEHTARNIMIKAVKDPHPDMEKTKKAENRFEALCREFHVDPSIKDLCCR